MRLRFFQQGSNIFFVVTLNEHDTQTQGKALKGCCPRVYKLTKTAWHNGYDPRNQS